MQGVYYRQSAKQRAIELQITGTVKNNHDGSVQVVATGNDEQLNELIAWCRIGPSKAIVENFFVEEIVSQTFSHFEIIH